MTTRRSMPTPNWFRPASSPTTAAATLLQSAIDDLLSSDFASTSTAAALTFGATVRVDKNHSQGGSADRVYTYLGTGLDSGGNPTTFDLTQVDFTDLDFWRAPQTDVLPTGVNLDDSDSVAVGGIVTMNDVRGGATASVEKANVNSGSLAVLATEQATVHATIDSTVESSGGSAFGTGTSLAVNGTIATNSVLGSAVSTLNDSTVVTTGDVDVRADNQSTLKAVNDSVTVSGADAIGVMLAFNTVGYQPQNPLFNSLDTLISSNIGVKQPAKTHALVNDSKLIAGGDIVVNADSVAAIDSAISNSTTSAASALINAAGKSVGAVVASNMVNSDVMASIEFGVGITEVNRTITAGGSLSTLANDSAAVTADTTLLSDSTTTNDAGTSLVNGLINDLIGQYDFSSHSGSQPMKFRDLVRVASDHSLPIGAIDEDAFEAGAVYRYLGTPATVNLATADYSDYGTWVKLDAFNTIGSGLNFTNSDSLGIGGLVVRNDVDGEVNAHMTRVVATTVGAIDVSGIANQTLDATTDSTVNSSGGSAFGNGLSLAVNGTIVTNNMVGGAEAYVNDSRVTTTGDTSADFNVTADNTATFTAINTNSTTSGDTAVGVTLAFNRLGYAPSNLLFNSIDAIFGTILGGTSSVGAKAWVSDTPIAIDGDLNITATNETTLTADISNATASAAGALYGASGKAGAAIIASNLVRSDATANLSFTSGLGSVVAGGDVNIVAKDRAGIDAGTTLESTSVTTNGDNVLVDFLGQFDKTYGHTSRSGSPVLTIGDKVRLAPDHSAGGVAGGIYRLLAPLAATNLAAVNYADSLAWSRVAIEVEDFDPDQGNVSDSNSRAVGLLLVRNDVRSEVLTTVTRSDIHSGADINLSALEQADLIADTTAIVTSSGGSMFGSGTSLAVSGTVATNIALSKANVDVANSQLTADGDLNVLAENRSAIEATLDSSTLTGDTAVGVTAAFNMLGVAPTNLFGTLLDSVIGVNIDLIVAAPAEVKATIRDTPIDVDGDVTVHADNFAELNADLSNAVESSASAITGASGKAVGIVLAANRVISAAEAGIQFTDGFATKTVTVDGSLDVLAENRAGNYSSSNLVAASETKNDGGLSITKNQYRAFDPSDATYLSIDGMQSLHFGDTVRLSKDHSFGGVEGSRYKYMGQDASINLSETDFSDTGYWKETSLVRLLDTPGNIGDSDSIAVGGILVRNDVRSRVDAYLTRVTVNAGDVSVKALENASIVASIDSVATSSGGSDLGEGTSLAINGVIAANLVLSSAKRSSPAAASRPRPAISKSTAKMHRT